MRVGEGDKHVRAEVSCVGEAAEESTVMQPYRTFFYLEVAKGCLRTNNHVTGSIHIGTLTCLIENRSLLPTWTVTLGKAWETLTGLVE